jgi:imidazoleglycerol phosphate dehydratase HisB
MDETLARGVVDLSGRFYLVYKVTINTTSSKPSSYRRRERYRKLCG